MDDINQSTSGVNLMKKFDVLFNGQKLTSCDESFMNNPRQWFKVDGNNITMTLGDGTTLSTELNEQIIDCIKDLNPTVESPFKIVTEG